MLKILFIRHAEAEESGHGVPGKDEKRRLTKKGRAQATTVGKGLRKLGWTPNRVYTSPLVRAVQTAQDICDALGSNAKVIETDALAPGGTWSAFKKEVLHQYNAEKKTATEVSVFAVGHQPGMSEMISEALGGKRSMFEMKKGACIGLAWENFNASEKPSVDFALDVKLAKKIRKLS